MTIYISNVGFVLHEKMSDVRKKELLDELCIMMMQNVAKRTFLSHRHAWP